MDGRESGKLEYEVPKQPAASRRDKQQAGNDYHSTHDLIPIGTHDHFQQKKP